MFTKQNCGRLFKLALTTIAAMVFSIGAMWAQNSKISGKVTNKNGEPLAGVYILVQGTKVGTSTDSWGKYEITASPKSVLVFSYLGMKNAIITVGSRSLINVIMEDDVTTLQEVVMVAYGSQKKESITGAVSTVSVRKTLESRPITDVGRALQGATAGLIVTTTEGSLGGSPSIKIRGNTSTLGGGTGKPLIVLDNVEVPDLSYVNPDDIESISVLKDAATTAIYGARAAFGAILITTKKGDRDGGIHVTYSNNFAWSRQTKTPEPLRPDQQLNYEWLQYNGLNATPTEEFSVIGPVYYNRETIAKVKDYWDKYKYGKQFGNEMVVGRDFDFGTGGNSSRIYPYRSWDINGMYYKKNAPQQSHNISISGGTQNTRYNISAGLLNERGLMKAFSDSYKRYNVRASVETDVNKYLTLRTGYMMSKSVTKTPFNYAASTYPPVYYMYRWSTIYPYGTYDGLKSRSAITELEEAKPVEDQTFYHRLNLGASLHIIKGLNVNFDYTANLTNWDEHTQGGQISAINWFNGAMTPGDVKSLYSMYTAANYNYVQESSSRDVQNTYNGNIIYDLTIKNHVIKVQVGTNIEDEEYKYHFARRNTPYDANKGELNLSGGDQSVNSSHSWWSVVGYYTRINYSYKDRYYLELNGRYDGSSKFSKDSRWGFFPSASAAWRVSEEKWMQGIKDIVSSLKLRLSIGQNGNQDVPLSSFYPTMSITNPPVGNSIAYWLINGNYTPYIGQAYDLVDSDLSWEKVTTYDAGIDASFLNGEINLTADVYKRITSDMLSSGNPLPISVGANAPKTNYGELTTNGIELSINYTHEFANGIVLNVGGQITDYKSKITKWNSDADPTIGSYYKGYVVGSIWGFKSAGLFQKGDFVYSDNGTIQTVTVDGKLQNVYKNLKPGYQKALESNTAAFMFGPGDMKFKDLDGDGIIDYGSNTIGDPGDRTIIGNSQPRYIFGFRIGGNWKGFDLDVFFQGVGKRHLWATGNTILPGYDAAGVGFKGTYDYWTEDNTDAYYPRPLNYSQAAKWNYVCNSKYLLNMAYLRLKTLTIGYTLPSKYTQKAMIQKVRVYFSGENLLTFDHLHGLSIDPEIDWTSATQNDSRSFGRSYPYRKTMSFGIQVDF